MDLFPDGEFVRLENRVRTGKYVHADGDWRGVSLRSLGTVAPLEAVWRVEHLDANRGGVFLLLQNAAYGRYLSYSLLQEQRGHRGRLAVQVGRNELEPPSHVLHASVWWWRVERVDPNQDYVRLRYADSHFFLRANGRYLTRNNGVTVDRRLTTMMEWTVHVVAASPVPLPLPVDPHRPRLMVRHVRADNEGNFNQDRRHWRQFTTYDNSVLNLRTLLGQLQPDWNGDMLRFTLCMQSGLYGRLMPLLTDLPRSLEPIYIVVFRTGSQGAATLVYPQINA